MIGLSLLSSDGYVFLVQNSPSWIGKCNSSQNSMSLRVLGIAGGLLSCEFPHCWWGCLKLPSQSARLVTSFRAWNFIPMQSLLGEATKNTLKIIRRVGSWFWKIFSIMPIKEAITLVTHEFSCSFVSVFSTFPIILRFFKCLCRFIHRSQPTQDKDPSTNQIRAGCWSSLVVWPR